MNLGKNLIYILFIVANFAIATNAMAFGKNKPKGDLSLLAFSGQWSPDVSNPEYCPPINVSANPEFSEVNAEGFNKFFGINQGAFLVTYTDGTVMRIETTFLGGDTITESRRKLYGPSDLPSIDFSMRLFNGQLLTSSKHGSNSEHYCKYNRP